jgi:predicted cupin superfamily sugar epimerase
MVSEQQKRRVNDYIIDHFEGGWYHPAMAAQIKEKTGFNMRDSGYTMFGFDYPASQDRDTFDKLLAIAKKYGFDLYQCSDLSYHNDKADGRKHFPAAMGKEIRELMCARAWRVAYEQLGDIFSNYEFADDALCILLYSTYAQNGLPRQYRDALTRAQLRTDTVIQLSDLAPLVIDALLKFPGPWYQDRVVAHFHLEHYAFNASNEAKDRLRVVYANYLQSSTARLRTVESILATVEGANAYARAESRRNVQPPIVVGCGTRYLIRAQ